MRHYLWVPGEASAIALPSQSRSGPWLRTLGWAGGKPAVAVTAADLAPALSVPVETMNSGNARWTEYPDAAGSAQPNAGGPVTPQNRRAHP